METNNVLKGIEVHNQNVLIKTSIKLGTLVLNGLIGNKTPEANSDVEGLIHPLSK